MAAAPSDDVATLRAAPFDFAQDRLARAEADAACTKAVNADLAARIALLKLQNEKMRRALFGRSAERECLLVDQLELGFEELETTAGEDEALAAKAAAGTSVEGFTRARPSRKPLPAHLPRERVVVTAATHCPCCGSDRLSMLAEDLTETPDQVRGRLLEVVPRRWKVVQTVAASGVDYLSGSGDVVRTHIGQNDGRASIGKGPGCGQPDPFACAGYEGYLAAEIITGIHNRSP